MRMRLMVIAIVIAAVAIGGFIYWRSRDRGAPPAAAPKDAAIAQPDAAPQVRAPLPPALPAEEVTANQEAAERTQLEAHAKELKLAKRETTQILDALAAMQAGRRALFADLAARKRPIEEVSAKLRELRDEMNATFVKVLGKDRAAKLEEMIRASHGFEAASPKAP
jgi:septal ring factor EnvC (AmiA/AmiB activator)